MKNTLADKLEEVIISNQVQAIIDEQNIAWKEHNRSGARIKLLGDESLSKDEKVQLENVIASIDAALPDATMALEGRQFGIEFMEKRLAELRKAAH